MQASNHFRTKRNLLSAFALVMAGFAGLWASGKDFPNGSVEHAIVENNVQPLPIAPAKPPIAAANVSRNFVLPPSPDCVDCGEGKLGYVLTGDPEIDAETKRIHQERLRERQERRAAESFRKSRQKHAIERQTWHGTILTPSPVSDPKNLEALQQFFPYFQLDLPAPEERRKWFAEYLRPDGKIIGNGWRVMLRSAKQVDDGWIVTGEVFISLVDETPGIVATNHSSIEEWHISSSGEMKCVSSVPGTAGVLTWQ